MKKLVKLLFWAIVLLPFRPGHSINQIRALIHFINDLLTLRKQSITAQIAIPFGKLSPCLFDRYNQSGSASGHYFHQDLLVARRIFANNPELHVDIGSRIDGFVAHVASYRNIEVFDIRPLQANIPNITFIQKNLLEPDHGMTNYCDSISCLHAIEHFGLGRYGDPVVYDGYLFALDNITKALRQGGKFYVSTPIGPQRIEFNAHRVFSVSCLLDLFTGRYHVDSF